MAREVNLFYSVEGESLDHVFDSSYRFDQILWSMMSGSRFDYSLIHDSVPVIATPIEMTASHNNVYVTKEDRQLEISSAESELLYQCIAPLFEEQGGLTRLSTGQWLINTPWPIKEVSAIENVLNQSVLSCMPTGSHALKWHRLMTECQMVLQHCQVNIERAHKGLPLVTGLWFWQPYSLSQKMANEEYERYTNSMLYSPNQVIKNIDDVSLWVEKHGFNKNISYAIYLSDISKQVFQRLVNKLLRHQVTIHYLNGTKAIGGKPSILKRIKQWIGTTT